MKLLTQEIVLMSLAVLLACSLHGFGATRTIEFTYLAGSQTWEDAYKALTDAFETKNPDIRVERVRVLEEYPNKVVALFASGTAPDVMSMDIEHLGSFGDERFVYDLNPFIKKTPEYQLKRVAVPALDAYTLDGKLYAAPILTNPCYYVYNTELFDLSGLAHPIDQYRRDNWTWAVFREAARKLTRKQPDGRHAVVGAILHLPRTWLAANGGQEFDDPKRPTQTFFDSESNLETLTFLHSLMWQDEAMLLSGGTATNRAIGTDGQTGFAQGKVGLGARWMSVIPQFAQGGFEMGLVPYPKGPGTNGRYATELGMFGISITQQARDVEAAWRYVSYMTGPEAAAIDAKLLGRTPARPVPLGWLPKVVVNPEIYADLLTYGTLRVISRDYKSLQGIIDKGLSPLWNNTVDVKAAASDIARQLRAFLSQNPQ